jgi:hypothetical protein
MGIYVCVCALALTLNNDKQCVLSEEKMWKVNKHVHTCMCVPVCSVCMYI